ncbi:MAG: PBP1A family penicillin-binding protein [Candidatus Pacebacteria bacterium]|nr:PBP1A family penicillin-binding protein [Candidatus Paceibacterota bacterium]MBP9866695.1 PBP1A family penicillin-binding protein [Candidatus Paceibacterota bacterium]
MSTHHSTPQKRLKRRLLKELFLILISLAVVAFALVTVWISTIQLPDFNNFENRYIANSTKIYDRTGKIVLYNIHDNIKRTEVPIAEMSTYIQQATISIEDAHFYEHYGFRPTSFLRAVIANITSGGYTQGGSTIDQQVVKNALLTREKTITRKIKEIILSIKLDKELPKDTILQIYLNESPYGGTIYGVEEASLTYFNKHAKDVTLTEAAYLAALPQSPTYYSPFGKHTDALEKRKNLVLQRMFELGYITNQEKKQAQEERVIFERDASNSGKALHFVMYIREYLENKYGEDVVQNGGLKVITTIDYDLQNKLETIVKEGALENEKKFKARNAALVASDPKTGQIIAMVGSRDFFDTEIPGQFNITTASRQPGSSIKPIVYAAAFALGYTPETVLFDVPTQFSTLCDAYGNPIRQGVSESVCYMPENYDGLFRGPISLRNALAQSLNIPAVKLLYLTGLQNAVNLSQAMGLSTIKDPSRYGLSMVLGGGEITLLELTNAYGVFADNGIYHKPQGILEIRDRDNTIIEKFTPNEKEVLSESVTALISSVLSDQKAKIPAYGANSPLFFGERPVASKTGTTNDYKDVWVIGYTPSIVIGMWGGNNDNSPINKKVAGLVLAPIWHKAMATALGTSSIEYFPDPLPNTSPKPILRGVYCSPEGIHTILTSVIKDNPNNGYPNNPTNDSQYELWETGIQNWLSKNSLPCENVSHQEGLLIHEGGVEIATTTVN